MRLLRFAFLLPAFVAAAPLLAQEPVPQGVVVQEPVTADPVTQQAAAKPAAEAAVKRFDMLEFEIKGNTVLSSNEIEKLVYRFLGPQRTLDDLEGVRQALEERYREAGYQTVSVDIPEQRVDSGVVRLQVNEATLSRVRVLGSRYYDQGKILAQVSGSLAEGTVPDFVDVQRDIAELNRGGSRRVTPVLRPGSSPGTTEMDLRVEDNLPLSGNIELNNQYSPNTSRLRLNGMVRYDNMFQREHSLSLQFQVTPEKTDESKAFSASYVVPLEKGRALAVYGVNSNSNVASLGSNTVLGKGNILGVRAIFPLPSVKRYSHTLVAGADYKSFDENLLQAGAPVVTTPIRYLPFSINYSSKLEDDKGSWNLSTGVSFSLRDVVGSEAAFENKRFNAHSNFFVLKWDVSRTHKLSDKFGLYARFDGQIADQPLVSNEQFVAGGVGSVRGYLQAEALGDDGQHGVLELRGPSLWGGDSLSLNELRPYAFLDGAHMRVREPLPGQRDRFTLTSAGLGLNLTAYHRLTMALNLAWPFRPTTYTQVREPRLHFSSTLDF